MTQSHSLGLRLERLVLPEAEAEVEEEGAGTPTLLPERLTAAATSLPPAGESCSSSSR